MALLAAGALMLSVPALCGAAFPGRNGKLAFGTTSLVDGTANVDIWTVEPSGESFARLTTEPESEIEPAWSANGRWIAFSKSPRPSPFPCCNRGGDIWIARADGTGQRRLTDGLAHDTTPSWSPDGTQIVFASGREVSAGFVDYDLYIVNADGTGLRLVVSGARNRAEYDPAWSPDGSRIAFATDLTFPCPTTCPTDLGLQTIRPDGSDVQVIVPPNEPMHEPDWAPDGGSIAYTNGAQILTVNADGSGGVELPNASGFRRATPAWSPDGTRIAFEGALFGHMNADGSSPVTLHSGVTGLSWQPLGPLRSDFRNGPAFCRAEREFLGAQEFDAQYATFGKCVSAKG